jgi:uroporphyrinogen decarboxylase
LPETRTAPASLPAPAGPAPARDPLFLRACRREAVERTPVWIMRQAGRYLPEYQALRAKHDFLTSCRTPELACELTLQPVRRLGVDAAILFSDILIPLPGMGVPVEFRPAPAISRVVKGRADVLALRTPDAREATPFVLDAVRLVRRELGGAVPLIGFAGAPFTIAAYLVEGGGSKSFAAWKGLLFSEPATAHLLLERCAEVVASYLREQVRAGAQAAMLFDTWAGILAPGDFRTFALPYARRVFEAVAFLGEVEGARPPRLYYGGEMGGFLESAAEVGADVLGLDWRIGLDAARRRLGSGIALQGNLDPAVLLGPPALIRERTAAILGEARRPEEGAAEGERPGSSPGHIFNLGHGILPATPADHARVLVDAVREFSTRSAS